MVRTKSNCVLIFAIGLGCYNLAWANNGPLMHPVSFVAVQENPLPIPFSSTAQAEPSKCNPSNEAPCVKLWTDMTAQERASLWPYLDPVTRDARWREMSPKERRALRSHLDSRGRDEIRHRFSVTPDADTASNHRRHQPMCSPEDRKILREQIIEMHAQLYGHDDPNQVYGTIVPPDTAPSKKGVSWSSSDANL